MEDLVPEQCAEPPSVADGVPKVLSELAVLADLAPQCIDPTDPLLDAVHAFGRVFDIDVFRSGVGTRVRVTPNRGRAIDQVAPAGGTVTVVF